MTTKRRNWCVHVVDDDATVNGREHETVFCGKPLVLGEDYCTEHLLLHAATSCPRSGDSGFGGES